MVDCTSSTSGWSSRIVLGLEGLLLHARGGGALWWRDGDGQEVLATGIDERGRQQRGEGHGYHEERAGDGQGAPLGEAILEGDHEHRRVEPLPDGHLRLAVLVELEVDLVHEPVGQHGDDGERHQQRGQQGEGHGQAEGQEELADDAADEADGQEDGDGGDGGAGDGAGDLPGAGDDRVVDGITQATVSVDVLQDHDGVVDHSARPRPPGRRG